MCSCHHLYMLYVHNVILTILCSFKLNYNNEFPQFVFLKFYFYLFVLQISRLLFILHNKTNMRSINYVHSSVNILKHKYLQNLKNPETLQ